MSSFLKKIIIIIIIILAVVCGYFWGRGKTNNKDTLLNNKTETNIATTTAVANSGPNIFKFHNFHGEDLGTSGFEFEYPNDWKNDGQYFSRQKINHYDITSTDAPVYFDLISEAIIDSSDLKYQITKDKRNKPDSEVQIAGSKFKKYDLFDYQSEGKDRVIIYVGPKINILGVSYYLIFHWEERPLGLEISGNNPDVFEKMVESLKFTK
jgi:hypothetical protein